MNKLLWIAAAFLVAACVSSQSVPRINVQQSNSLKLDSARMLTGFYSSGGTFSLVSAEAGIVQQNPGVYINVYYEETTEGTIEFNQKGGTVMLGLYTNQTILALDECVAFDTYNCSQFSSYCKQSEDEDVSLDFPDFSTKTGNYGKTKVFIDSNYWNLTTDLLFVKDCSAYRKSNFGAGVDGIIGMGVGGDSIKNFPRNQSYDSIMGGTEVIYDSSPPVFSFYLLANGKSGDLIFEYDSSKARSTTAVATLPADSNWHVSGVTSVKVGSSTFAFEEAGGLIFDINSDALGLPMKIYKKVIDAIDKTQESLVCPSPSEVTYRPKCKYPGNINVLPNITINVAGQKLSIPPSTYAEVIKVLDTPSKEVYLNIRGLSSDNDNEAYVTEAYENYVILDQHVMGYYYTVFDTTGFNATDPDKQVVHIKLYEALHGKSTKALWIIIICTVIGLIVGLSIYRYREIKKARITAKASLFDKGEQGEYYEMEMEQKSPRKNT